MRAQFPSPTSEFERQLITTLGNWMDTLRPGSDVGMLAVFAVALPVGWLECDGTEFLNASYPALARLLGDTFGSPSSSTKTVLPNIATPLGADTLVGIKT